MHSEYFRYEDGKLYRLSTGKVAGTSQGKYLQAFYKGKNHYVHRIIWELHNGSIPEGLTIDHINGDSFDNRIENLRLCTLRQNNANRSGKGYHKRGDKFRVHFNDANSKTVCGGTYHDEELAELVAKEIRLKMYGEYVRSNP